MFDAEEYAAALEELIGRLQHVKNYLDPNETQGVFERICRLLRIGKIQTIYFQTPAHEMSGKSQSAVLYDCGGADEAPDRAVRMREPIENGAVSHYIFMPITGEADWSDGEKERMKTLQKLIFAYNGRANLLLIANNLTYNDIQLEIPNLAFCLRKMGELIARGKIGEYAASYFNLRHFAVVNNQVGRDEGTVIMKKYVHGLRDKYSGDECVGRIGGDNFITLFRKERLEEVKEHLNGVKIKSERYHAEFLINAYAGIYMIDAAECKTPMDVMDRAAVVAGIAKKNPGSPFVFYTSEIQERVKLSKQIEDMVPDALRAGEFLVYYQPKVSMKDYTLIGAEALCRWQHNGEMIQPFRFIPVLERSKLICELDFYMLDHVCRDLRRWMDEGKEIVKVSVNLSRMHLGDANLLDDIINTIDKHGVPHEYIEIELTETTTDVDYGELKRVVIGLREAGVSTSVDDFGVGYSSLNLIRELPWNVLKIDRSFLPDGTGNEKQRRTMLKYVIAMAQELGLECIVEGVETMDQVMLLKENGCYLAQGFYFDRPLPVGVFEERLGGTA